MNRFYVIPLVAIRLRSAIAILNRNHYRNLGQQEKLVLPETFIVNNIETNNISQLFYDICAIIYHIVVSIVSNSTIYNSDKCLNSQIKKLSNKKGSSGSSPISFQHGFFEQHIK